MANYSRNKSIIFISLLSCLLGSGGLACSPCNDLDCGKHGACNEADGSCYCDTGYQVNAWGRCDSVSREKFLGTYNATEICVGASVPYSLVISAGQTGIDKITLAGLGGYQTGNDVLQVQASVEKNEMTILEQDITFNNQLYHIFATNCTMMEKDKLIFSYKIAIDGTVSSDCSLTLIKQ